MASLLDQLRTTSTVDCDTLDVEVATRLGPFADCTSNQAIAFAELSKLGADGKPLYQQLILESIQAAHWLFGKQSDATVEELAVELMMVGLSLRFAAHTTGFLHVQTNPKLAYSTPKTIKNAERIVSHFKQLAPAFDTSRVCVKIPATWEGLQACRELEKKGIATLATTVFSLEQAVLAADAGCRYVAPYVNELRVHFDPSYVDTNPALELCGAIQEYFESRQNTRTQVVAASLTSTAQVMQLAGLRHITVSPPLLAELAATPAAGWTGTVGQAVNVASPPAPAAAAPNTADVATPIVPAAGGAALPVLGPQIRAQLEALLGDESLWRIAFTRSDGGRSETKLVQAINIFADVQDKLEELVRQADTTLRATAA